MSLVVATAASSSPSSFPAYDSMPAGATECEYFPVALHKFVVLSLCTFGFYEVYWCYRNWARIQTRTTERLSPFWRAFFSSIWCFSLFQRIHESSKRSGGSPKWIPGLLGVSNLTLALCWRLPGAWWLIGFASFIAFIPVVQTVRLINSQSRTPEVENGSYDLINFAVIVVGGLLTILAVAGSFLPDVPTAADL